MSEQQGARADGTGGSIEPEKTLDNGILIHLEMSDRFALRFVVYC